ncbi:MAG: hypothetical protein IPK74_39645 [Deltaproteobacteria bacterium]|nr:hypothetical protein [Deltaproteobacteria bacterium]
MDNTTRDRGDAMTDQLPLSVQAELAEARANADRVRRLEAELRDAQDCASMCKAERDGFAAALVSEQEKRKQAEASIYSMTCTKQAFDELEQVTRERESARNERFALQAKLDGASKVIAEMAANRDRLQAELQDAQFALALEQGKRRHAEASSSAQAFDGLKRKLDAALREAEELRTMVIDGGEVVKTQRKLGSSLMGERAADVGKAERQRDAALREVAILREAQRLVPRDLAPKHPACACAKLPRVHPYEPRSCTAAGDESMRRDG